MTSGYTASLRLQLIWVKKYKHINVKPCNWPFLLFLDFYCFGLLVYRVRFVPNTLFAASLRCNFHHTYITTYDKCDMVEVCSLNLPSYDRLYRALTYQEPYLVIPVSGNG